MNRLWIGVVAIAALCGAGASVVDPLRAAVRSPRRDPIDVARDPARHPEEVLRFLGVLPTSSVVEVWPGPKGYWTQILAPYLHDRGTYVVALGDADGSNVEGGYAAPPTALRALPAERPAGFDRVAISRLSARHLDLLPPAGADYVLTFRNLHNWMADGDAPQILAALHSALKPGGVLGIEDHCARPDRSQDPRAADGYVRQDYATALIERAGFKLVATSEIERNPKDTTHWPKGVWTLPPTYALGQTDHAKYQAVGESNRFLLKFQRVD